MTIEPTQDLKQDLKEEQSLSDWINAREDLIKHITSLNIPDNQKDNLFYKCDAYTNETVKRALFKFSNKDVMLFAGAKDDK